MKVVNVEFKKGGKQYIFSDNGLEANVGEKVIVETERGLQFGVISKSNYTVSDDESHASLIRIATKKDEIQNERIIKEAARCVEKAQEIANGMNLDMKFIDGFYTFDQRQLVLQFLADNRVDFRDLAKSLAGVYRTRIELRQVGVRDKAKEVSGIGCCGRKICCSSFLNDLDSVSISMVKNQNLALNPNKINGLCGRLLCCLKYEDDNYTENRKCLPNVGEKIKHENEEGTVIYVDIPSKKYKLLTESGNKIEVCCDKCANCTKREKNDERKSNK